MATHVTEEDIQRFKEDGVVCLRNVFDQTWLEKVAAGVNKNLASPSIYSENLRADGGDGYYFNDYCNWKEIAEFRDFAYNSPAAEVAGLLMESEYSVFYHEHVLSKEPGTTKITPWHHDQAYYPIDGVKNCSIWLPLDPVTKDNTLFFVKGSHRWGWYYPRKFATENKYQTIHDDVTDKDYENLPDIDGNRDKYDILYWEMEPGDCVVFHMKCLHGAPGNPSRSGHRRVLSTRWVGDDAVLAQRPWDVSPPILGGLNYGDRVISDTFPLIWKRQ